MSRSELTPISYVVMGLVGQEGAGPHDIRLMARRGARLYWAAGESQYYAEPKRLAGLGYLQARKEPGRTGERTHYTLTPKGVEALREWAGRPSAFPRMQNAAAARLMVADIVGEAPVLASIRALREDLGGLEELLDASEARAAELPHRTRYLMLNHRLARRLVDAHRAWADEVERELGRDPRRRVER